MTGADWIRHLGLEAHPEGGHFKEVYRSDERIARSALPGRYSGDRAFATSIYYLLRSGEISRKHRIQSDEIWHHYDGSALELTIHGPDGRPARHLLGKNPDRGETPQLVVPRGLWFEARVAAPDSFVLVGCTVAPGFDFADFELQTDRPAPDAYGSGDASYRAAGEEAGIRKLCDDFYHFMSTLPEAAHIRSMHKENLETITDKLTLFLCGWLGGPRKYGEKYGPIHIPMAHRHLVINEPERDAWLLCMQKAVDRQPWADAFKRYFMTVIAMPAEKVRQTARKS